MKLPIIIDDNGDVSIFQSVEDAEKYIESPDVLDSSYIAYDADGMHLDLIAHKTKKIKLLGLELITVKKIIISDSQDRRSYRDQLILTLIDILKKQQAPIELIVNANLKEILDKCVDALGYTK